MPSSAPQFTITFLKEVDSTNRYLLEQIDTFDQHSVVVSDIQTAGRGRRGRSWDSSIRGNLYMSLLEKSDNLHLRMQEFVLLMAEAVCGCCREILARQIKAGQPQKPGFAADGEKFSIHPPNDIYYDEKKLGGILCQSRMRGGECLALVLGLGLNIAEAPRLDAQSPIDRRGYSAIALNEILPQPINRNEFLSQLLAEYSQLHEKHSQN